MYVAGSVPYWNWHTKTTAGVLLVVLSVGVEGEEGEAGPWPGGGGRLGPAWAREFAKAT